MRGLRGPPRARSWRWPVPADRRWRCRGRGRRCRPRSGRLPAVRRPAVARMNSSGMLIRMPAPSPVFSSAPTAPRWSRLTSTSMASVDDLALGALVQGGDHTHAAGVVLVAPGSYIPSGSVDREIERGVESHRNHLQCFWARKVLRFFNAWFRIPRPCIKYVSRVHITNTRKSQDCFFLGKCGGYVLGCGGCRYRCVSLCWWLSEEYRGADVAEMGVCPDPYGLNRVVPA